MLIHLTPRMFACPHTEPCTLIDLACDELGLMLKGDRELTARRPYPNPKYLVACRKVGRKAMDGFLVETPQPLREFTVVTRWAVAASHTATHRLRYIVLDEEFDALSENMLLWSYGDWKPRWPDHYKHLAPVQIQPRMEVSPQLENKREVVDRLDRQGFLIERSEVFRLHTIERDRLLNVDRHVMERIPSLDMAFRVER
ncbi:DUF6012 family protein [Azotobacter vinelandii]|uniref:DUF6012 family protein n=1 Tax=Azotobacter vinelandii TaxID=354 RepID=UPI000772F731|nr:DUF6012 family protein [Azotobacter vinelandii]